MTSITYARLALLFPYLTLIGSIGYFKFHKYEFENAHPLQYINEVWNFLVFFWFVPYTILAIYLFIWSISKTKEQIQSTYTNAPIKMIFVAPLTYVAILIIGSIFDHTSFKGAGPILIILTAFSVPASIIFGYIFVGISILFYKLLQKIKVIRD